MKLTANSLLLLVLSGTLSAQSQTAQLKPSPFPPFTHVVVIVQENRSPDNLFHFLKPLCPIPSGATGLKACTPSPVTSMCYDISPCGLSNAGGLPKPVTLTGVPMKGSTDPEHYHSDFENMCDPEPLSGYACKNDGAWHILQTVAGETSYSYVKNPAVTNYDGSSGHLLDPYLYYAENYGWANYMHQTNQGPSYAAHQFIFSGTSARSATEDSNSTFVSELFSTGALLNGCLAPAGDMNSLISPLIPPAPLCSGGKTWDGGSVQECPVFNTALSYPTQPVGTFCQTKPNMGDTLSAQTPAISWKYYAPSADYLWTAPNSIQDICNPKFINPTSLECHGAQWTTHVDVKLKGADVLNDISNCKLPSVTWVIPNGTWSDHAGQTDNLGPSWVAAIINAIGESKTNSGGLCDYWKASPTAIIVTWDDWGGWSDNQRPPVGGLPCSSSNCQADYQLGFRVPLIVVSAYTPLGYINNKTNDFGSILRMIEGNYGIAEGALGLADKRSTRDLSSFFTGAFRTYTPVPALKPASYFLGAEAQSGPPAPPDNDGDDH